MKYFVNSNKEIRLLIYYILFYQRLSFIYFTKKYIFIFQALKLSIILMSEKRELFSIFNSVDVSENYFIFESLYICLFSLRLNVPKILKKTNSCCF